MTRWTCLVIAIMAADVAVAYADDDAAEATPAAAGETPDAAIDAALRAAQPGDAKLPGCEGTRRTVARKASLGAAGELRVMTVPLDCPTTTFALVFGANQQWWSSPPTELVGSDCGMGHCIEKTLVGMTIHHRRDRVAVTFRVREARTTHVPGGKNEVSILRQTLTCTLGAAPTCTEH
jgi:hypothetical protein